MTISCELFTKLIPAHTTEFDLGTRLSGTPANSGLANFGSEKSWPSYFVDKKNLVGIH